VSATAERAFAQVDVFGRAPYLGNPVAVVLDGTGLSAGRMQQLARWTNLSETTFVLPPSDPAADYAVRIFTGSGELPFAGHPTLGTCHAWLESRAGAPEIGNRRGAPDEAAEPIVQECGAGLVRIRRLNGNLAFEAPALLRCGPVEEPLLKQVAEQLGIGRDSIVDASWADNGPGWVAVLLADAAAVLALAPVRVDMMIGVAGPYPPGSPAALEVRAFCPAEGSVFEDPVTGSLNAGLAQWLLATGRAAAPYVASQGGAIGRAGRVEISLLGDAVHVGGATSTCIRGTVDL
jgi:PhzF family phenazine biosynthesis protein